MKHNVSGPNTNLIEPPAFPFSARQLFADLRSRLALAEHCERIGFERLARIIGKSKSTAHHWFEVFDHPHLIAIMCLLERLSPKQRHAFVDSHCRPMPTLEHLSIAHAPGKVGQLMDLLNQKRGLTLVVGGTDYSRTFLVTALAHTYRRLNERGEGAIGIDIHVPSNFVPVESLTYIGASTANKAKLSIEKLWPKFLTTSGRLLIFNGLWNVAPDARQSILACCDRNHVLVAETGTPNLRSLQQTVSTPVHLVTLSSAKRVSGATLIRCRRIKTQKAR